jgi:predicted RNase H-like HicB family nuclease
MNMYKYPVIIEKSPDRYSAYAPDVPGVGTAGDTVADTLENR